jgi:hypothetical protein
MCVSSPCKPLITPTELHEHSVYHKRTVWWYDEISVRRRTESGYGAVSRDQKDAIAVVRIEKTHCAMMSCNLLQMYDY